jgi:hypothetical protein
MYTHETRKTLVKKNKGDKNILQGTYVVEFLKSPPEFDGMAMLQECRTKER